MTLRLQLTQALEFVLGGAVAMGAVLVEPTLLGHALHLLGAVPRHQVNRQAHGLQSVERGLGIGAQLLGQQQAHPPLAFSDHVHRGRARRLWHVNARPGLTEPQAAHSQTLQTRGAFPLAFQAFTGHFTNRQHPV